MKLHWRLLNIMKLIILHLKAMFVSWEHLETWEIFSLFKSLIGKWKNISLYFLNSSRDIEVFFRWKLHCTYIFHHNTNTYLNKKRFLFCLITSTLHISDRMKGNALFVGSILWEIGYLNVPYCQIARNTDFGI